MAKRDINWRADKMEKAGNYLVCIVTSTKLKGSEIYLSTIYGYWDGSSKYIKSEDDKKYPIKNIVMWAYDGAKI